MEKLERWRIEWIIMTWFSKTVAEFNFCRTVCIIKSKLAFSKHLRLNLNHIWKNTPLLQHRTAIMIDFLPMSSKYSLSNRIIFNPLYDNKAHKIFITPVVLSNPLHYINISLVKKDKKTFRGLVGVLYE